MLIGAKLESGKSVKNRADCGNVYLEAKARIEL
jgi:hypothetical protein